jgi:glycosyltransferase involved in cell wall biosynthesis
MRIAVVCSDPDVAVPGTEGASLQLQSTSTALADLGHDVLLVGVRGHGERPPGLRSLLLEPPGRSSGLRRELRTIRFTAGFAQEAVLAGTTFAPDVVYERLAPFGTAGRRLAQACASRHVVEVDALPAQEEPWRTARLAGLARRRERAVLDGADLRVAVSAEVAAQVDRVSPGGITEVVANGLDDTLFRLRPARGPARMFFGLPQDVPVLAFVGDLQPWHGLDVAIRALPLLPAAVLCVAGDSPIRGAMAQLAGSIGVGDRVHWLGHRPHAELPRLLAAADLALAPDSALPASGSSPQRLYEYLGAGVPVVASDLGPIRTVLDDGRWGRLVAPGDAEALATGVRAVLADPSGARSRAESARAMALEHHSWRARAARITDLLAGRRCAPRSPGGRPARTSAQPSPWRGVVGPPSALRTAPPG